MATVNITADKQVLLDRLQESQRTLLAAATAVLEQYARICPEAGRWSVLDVVEHITLSDRGMFKRFQAGTENTKPVNLGADAFIQQVGRNRESKRNAPEHVHPSGRFASLAEALSEYARGRAEIAAFIENSHEDFRRKLVQHPVMEMDGHQLFLLIAAHSERHSMQIEEIKNCAAYQAAHRTES
jgi:uncharacterized damage-inducible protein DinB